MSITWKRAAKLCGADAKELKDWPERLSIEQAAILAAGNRSADFTAAAEAMHEAIEQGDLPAEDAERPREVRMLLSEPDRFEVLHAGPCKMVSASDVLAWLDEQGQDPGEHVRAWDDCIQDRRGRELARAAAGQIGLFQPVETPPAVAMAEAARMGLAGLLASKAIQSPPEFLTGREVPEPLTEEGQRKRRAELAEEDERIRLRVREQWEMEQREAVGEADQGQQAAKPKRETQADRIGNVATECERRAVELRLTFDRSKMPGTKADFLELLHALDADLRSIKTVESLDRYLKGAGCKWPLEAGKQPSAVPLYASLFPEAPIRAPGAVSPQRRKA